MAMSDTDLQALLVAQKRAAVGGGSVSWESKERGQALSYYLGDMSRDMPAPEGRSQAVSKDVARVIEDILPQLIEVFAAGDEVLRFEPVGAEDEDAAAQETDYVNHVFWQENEGFRTLYTFFKDALLLNTGVVKVWWESKTDTGIETYRGLAPEEMAFVLAAPEVEVAAHTAQADGTHDVTLHRRQPVERAQVKALPPEEFLISPRAGGIEDSPYCAHRSRRTVSDLLAEGYDSELVRSLPSGSAASGEIETQERDRRRLDDDSSTVNEAMREVDVTEHYIRADLDGSGLARLWKAATAGSGDTLLTRKGQPDLEPVDEMPFASITPVMVSHRFEGLSIAELVMDIQRIKTALLRQWLDNIYFQNNQRVEVSEQHASDHTLDDLLTNRPGGLVRTRMPGGIIPIPNNPIGQHIAPLLQYMDSETEQRSGATRQGMGLDPNALQRTTATGANLFANAAQMRVRMIARIFAETGLKRLFMLLHGALRKHQDKEKVVRLRGRWVPVDPRGWRTRSDMTVHVGLGTGSRDQQQQYLMQILGFQAEAVKMQGGIAGPLVGLPNLYNTLKRLVENAGLRSVQPYFMAPGEGGAAPQPKTDSKADEVQAQLQLDRMKAEGQLAIDKMRAEAEARLARERMLAEIALKHEQVRLAALAPPLAPQAVQLGGRMG